MFAQECRDILALIPMPHQPPTLKLPDIISKPFGQETLSIESLDLDALIKMQYQHQTRHVALAVPTQSSSTVMARTEGTERQQEESICWQIIKEMHAILKEQQGQGAGTGKERAVCWHYGDGDKTRSDEQGLPVVTGNAANAAEVASQMAKKVHYSISFYKIWSVIKLWPVGSRSEEDRLQQCPIALPRNPWGSLNLFD